MPIADVDGVPLAYDDLGAGPVVVLLHAGIADRSMWVEQNAALSRTHRVLAVDLPGYGESGVPERSYANHDLVVGLLDALDIGDATWVGCSFGGSVALDVALAHPTRVNALVLMAAVVSGHAWSPEFREQQAVVMDGVDEDDLTALARAEVRFWVVGPGRDPADVDPALIARATAMDQRALASELALDDVDRRELDPPAITRLGELAMPVLVLAGAEDAADIRRLADLVAATAPRAARAPDLPDAAHLLPVEQPEEISRRLLAFLSDL